MAIDDGPAIRRLRTAMLLYIVGFVILSVGTWASVEYSEQIKSHVPMASPIMPVLLLVVGAVIVLMGASNVYVSFRMMKKVDRIYNIGRYGDLVQYSGSILLIIGFYFIIFSNSPALQRLGPEFTIAGYLIGFVGTLPVALAFYKLGKRHGVFLVKIGAVAYFVLPIIGPLMLYFGLKEIAGKT